MTTPGKLLRVRFVLAVLITAVISCLLAAGVIAIKRAQHAANLCTAYGRLCQMRLALQNYERVYDALPPICLKDVEKKPTQSWRALIFPYLETQSLKQVDLSQPWDSEDNHKIIDNVPQRDWGWFARDRIPSEQHPPVTHIVALLGKDSIWDANTGLPKGPTCKNLNAILLISIPESDIHPLEPRDITESELRVLVENGVEALFINSNDHGYGIVRLDGGELTFQGHPDD
jgi:hypothetical protein